MSHVFYWIIALSEALLVLGTAGHALLFKRDPKASLGWIAVCLLLPIAGPLLYLLFGINRVRTRAKRLTQGLPFFHHFHHDHPEILPGTRRQEDLPPEFREIAAISNKVTRRPVLDGNRVDILHNGEQAYPAMLEAIEGAKRSLYLATYILESNETGYRFMEALARARERGVDVRVMIDGIGDFYSFPRSSRVLSRKGVRTARFLPPTLVPPSLHINLRNHRKILTADGRTAFVGGMNIGDRHLAGDVRRAARVEDLHFRIVGPVARQIEDVFLSDWSFVTGEDAPVFEDISRPAGTAACRSIVDGPDEDLDKLSTVITGVVSTARHSVCIVTPYFLPSREMIGALQSAALRDVDISIFLPARNNLPFVHWATRNMLWELLQWGIRVYYQPPPFVHTKVLVVDGRYALVGSANMDPRSLRLNFELGVEVYDRTVAAELAAFGESCRRRSREVFLKDMDGRTIPEKIRDSLAWLFSPYL